MAAIKAGTAISMPTTTEGAAGAGDAKEKEKEKEKAKTPRKRKSKAAVGENTEEIVTGTPSKKAKGGKKHVGEEVKEVAKNKVADVERDEVTEEVKMEEGAEDMLF